MNWKLIFTLAYKYLLAKKTEGFISVISILSFLGIVIGVATLITVMSVMTGFRKDLVNTILGVNAHISIFSKTNHKIAKYNLIQNRVKNNVDNITAVTPVINAQGLAVPKYREAKGVMIKGIEYQDFIKRKQFSQNIKKGDVDKFKQKNHIIIGKVLAKNLNLSLGSKLEIIAPAMKVTLFGSIPNSNLFTVAAIIDYGMYEYNDSVVIMKLNEVQQLFQYGNTAEVLEVITDKPDKVKQVEKYILKLFDEKFKDTPIVTYNWQKSNVSLMQALEVEKIVMIIILSLIILVATFNIMAGLVMMVNDKQSNIAILKTMGMSDTQIMMIFSTCGLILALAGTLVGTVVGIIIVYNIEAIVAIIRSITGFDLFNSEVYHLSSIPAVLSLTEIIMVNLAVIILSTIATLYPVWKVAKLRPAIVLRND